MLEYMRLIRLERCIIAAAFAWLGTLLAGPLTPQTNSIIGIVSVFLIAAGGFSINNFFDAESDKLNRPDNPVAKGKVSKRAALATSVIFFALGIALAYLISFDVLALSVIASGLLVAYSAQLKRTLLIGNLITSGLAALAFVFGSLAAGNYVAALPLAFMIFLSNTSREIYKSIESSLTDRKYEETSIAIRLGVGRSRITANIFLLVAVIFSLALYATGLLGITYLFFVLISDIILLCAAVAPVRFGAKLIFAGIIVSIVAFLVGGIPI